MVRTIAGVIAILAIAFGVQVYRAHQPPAPYGGDGLVPVASTEEVLALIREGKKVVFVDAREEQEWREERIPGAINLSLRDVSSLDPSTLGNPDLVIAYCLKDFRGFEVAKALRAAGVENSSILAELGINGWKKRGLPTFVAERRSEQVATAALQLCAKHPAQCQDKAL